MTTGVKTTVVPIRKKKKTNDADMNRKFPSISDNNKLEKFLTKNVYECVNACYIRHSYSCEEDVFQQSPEAFYVCPSQCSVPPTRLIPGALV